MEGKDKSLHVLISLTRKSWQKRWRGKLQLKGRDDHILPQLTMATYQPVCLTLIIGRAHNWEQFAPAIFSSTKSPSDWINSRRQHVRRVGFGKERKQKPSSRFLHFSSKKKVLNRGKQNRKMQPSEGSKHSGTGMRCVRVCAVTPAGLLYRSGLGLGRH